MLWCFGFVFKHGTTCGQFIFIEEYSHFYPRRIAEIAAFTPVVPSERSCKSSYSNKLCHSHLEGTNRYERPSAY